MFDIIIVIFSFLGFRFLKIGFLKDFHKLVAAEIRRVKSNSLIDADQTVIKGQAFISLVFCFTRFFFRCNESLGSISATRPRRTAQVVAVASCLQLQKDATDSAIKPYY